MTPTPTRIRTETMIALRARRQAMKIARDIAYPQTPERLMSGAEMTRLLALSHQIYEWSRQIAHAVRIAIPPEQLAPRWMKWFAAGCVLAIAAATMLIFKITR